MSASGHRMRRVEMSLRTACLRHETSSSTPCLASVAAYHRLVQEGYTNVRRYAGGIEDWESASKACESFARCKSVRQNPDLPRGLPWVHSGARDARARVSVEIDKSQQESSSLAPRPCIPSGVPQGSFTNHFASKEAFGLEILERYREMTSAGVRASEAIRTRVASVFAGNQASVAYCLEAAIDAGELAPDTDVQELAGFIVSSLQGAILVAKAQRSPIPVERFERVLFHQLLPQVPCSSR
jgi:TetR/AcrR family transcriptional regulator, transcriptional repressor for nem operon